MDEPEAESQVNLCLVLRTLRAQFLHSLHTLQRKETMILTYKLILIILVLMDLSLQLVVIKEFCFNKSINCIYARTLQQ